MITEEKQEKKEITEKESESNIKLQSLYNLHKDVFNEFILVDNYFKELIKPESGQDEQFIRAEFNKITILAELKYQIKKTKALEFYDEYQDVIEQKIAYCKNEMTIHEINVILKEVQNIVIIHDDNIDNLRKQKKSSEQKVKNQEKENKRKEELKKTYIIQIKSNP